VREPTLKRKAAFAPPFCFLYIFHDLCVFDDLAPDPKPLALLRSSGFHLNLLKPNLALEVEAVS
jgi:hypothetical protein